MFDLEYMSFAKHGDNFFLHEDEGVLIVSEAVLGSEHEDIQKEKEFLFSKRQEVLSALVAQLQASASFLLTCDLPNEAVLLTKKTTVTLSNIEISVRLFFVLLEKTKVDVGEDFSITGNIYNEDCIREHGMRGNTPICLRRSWVVSSFALENIKRMPPNSIGCVLEEVEIFSIGLISILPKLRINEDSKVENLRLYAWEEAHVAALLRQEKPVCVGRVKNMDLKEYAVGVLTKMSLEDCEFEKLSLYAWEEAHVAALLKQEKPVCVGRVKEMFLEEYAVGVITKVRVHKDCGVEYLRLTASEEAHVAAVLRHERKFCVGRVKRMELQEYAVCVIMKMSLEDFEFEKLILDARREEYVSVVLEYDKTSCDGILKNVIFMGCCAVQEQKICVRRVKDMWLSEYAVGVLTKMSLEDCEFEKLSLYAWEEEHVAAVLRQEKTIYVWRVKRMELRQYAVSILLKLIIHEDNTMESLDVTAYGKELSRILKEGDSSIELGRIRKSGFCVPEKIKRKLRYTLIDEEGNEVLEEGDSSGWWISRLWRSRLG
ncbi:MAG: uncharacterized protein A8A55_0437 [Amphiamblys sp. WSBS2006]|nr:MAG: uncharacterized protein A8A55_0437 [Amphiamblys sp. WSBS2006]